MARKIVVFDNYSGGEFGRLGSAKAPKSTFTATNMVVTMDGSLSVRPGLKKINPSGLSNGLVHGFGTTPVPDNDLWFIQGTAVRTFNSSASNLKTSGTALAETPTKPVDWRGDVLSVVIASATDKLYRITPETGVTVPTVAALTGSPGAECVEIYGNRIVAANIDGSQGYRLRFSDVADPNSWPAANFVDVGDNWHIHGLYSQRQHLAIAKQSSFHVLTGSLGSSQVLRKVASVPGGLIHPLHGRMSHRDTLWYQDEFSLSPASFIGTYPTEFFHIEYSPSRPSGTDIPPSHGVAPLSGYAGHSLSTRGADSVAYVSDEAKAALFMNGAWTTHSFGVTTSGFVASGGGSVYICDGGGASSTPNFYVWNPTLDTPGIEGGAQRAGDDSSTSLSGSVTFPEWWATDASDVYVRAVVVDFKKYNTGSATNNHFDLTVNALRRYQAGAAQASTTVSFDEAASSSSATGTLERRVFGFGEQGMGNGFELAFAACKGIAIQRIEVVLETQPVRV